MKISVGANSYPKHEMSLESTISVKIPSMFLAYSSNSSFEDLQKNVMRFCKYSKLLIGTNSVRVDI